MSKTYRHYGKSGAECGEFRPEKFVPIKNQPFSVKPYHGTGYWASPVDSKWGWAEWCVSEEMPEWIKDSEYFDFTLKPGTNLLYLSTRKDLADIMTAHPDWIITDPVISSKEIERDRFGFVYLDFEQMVKDGIDAIEVKIDNELYWKLYGWDCDSILVMNPDVVVGRR